MRIHNGTAHTVSTVRLLGCGVCAGRSDQSACPNQARASPSVSLFSAAPKGKQCGHGGAVRSRRPVVCQPHAAEARAERRDAKQQATDGDGVAPAWRKPTGHVVRRTGCRRGWTRTKCGWAAACRASRRTPGPSLARHRSCRQSSSSPVRGRRLAAQLGRSAHRSPCAVCTAVDRAAVC